MEQVGLGKTFWKSYFDFSKCQACHQRCIENKIQHHKFLGPIMRMAEKVRQSRNEFCKPTLLPKNEFDFTTMIPQVDLFSFVFWKKLKTPKRHFEINWPLSAPQIWKPNDSYTTTVIKQGRGQLYPLPPFNPSSDGPGIYMGAVGRWEWRIVAREEHSGVNLFTTLMYFRTPLFASIEYSRWLPWHDNVRYSSFLPSVGW